MHPGRLHPHLLTVRVKRALRRLLLPLRFRAERLVKSRNPPPIVASYITRNWGDAFNIELGTRLFGVGPLIADLETVYESRSFATLCPDPWFLVGSILQRARPRARVCGSGLMTPSPPRPAPQPIAVRGQLTRKALESVGVTNTPPLGDPALLIRYMPDLTPKTRLPTIDVGLIPHYSDARHPALEATTRRLGATLIDIRSNTPTLLAEAARCGVLLASSLHGLIISHALGIPYVWVSIGDRIGGGHFKFHDFLSTCGPVDWAISQRPIPLEHCTRANIARHLHRPNPIDLRPLIEAFPHRSTFLDECHRSNSRDLQHSELSRITPE